MTEHAACNRSESFILKSFEEDKNKAPIFSMVWDGFSKFMKTVHAGSERVS